VLCIRSAEFSGNGVSPPFDREWMADDYLKKFAPVATHPIITDFCNKIGTKRT
jgi:hypothetical protein